MQEPTRKEKLSWVRVLFAVAAIVLVASYLLAPRVGGHDPRPLQNLHNLHLIGLAMTNYATGYGGHLPPSRSGDVGHNWRVSLSPHLDDSDLVLAYHHDAAWDSPENKSATNQWVPTMTSPYRPKPRKDAQGRGYRDYGLISGPGTANPPDGPVTLDFISEHDGMATTILVGECSGLQLIWTEPRDPDVSREKIGITRVTSSKGTSDSLLSSFAQSHAVALFADGSGKTLSYDIDPKVLAALCTVNGSEAIRYEDLR